MAPTLPLLLSTAALLSAATVGAGAQAPSGQDEGLPAVYTLPDGTRMPTRDRRAWAADPTDDLAATHPELQQELDRLFAAAVVRRARSVGLDPAGSPVLQALAARAGAPPSRAEAQTDRQPIEPPPPGGVGYGTIYVGSALSWSESTASWQKMVAPRSPGGDVTTWLYSTTTNRSELGVEAFVSYNGQTDFRFMVFDWARFPDAPWQTQLLQNQLREYLESVESPDGVWRSELTVLNETFATSTNNWRNRVWLENQITGTMDLVYDYGYTTASPSDNTYQSGDGIGWWGPIFETFQEHDGSNKPIGWNDCWLVQDGNVRMLTNANTYIRVDDGDLTPPIFHVANHAWAVGSTETEPQVQLLEAESGRHGVGEASGLGWLAGPAHGPGKMLKGPPFRDVPEGRKNAEFRFKVDNLTGPAGALVTYGVYDLTTRMIVKTEELTLAEFVEAGVYQPFRTNFTPIEGHDYILGAISQGLHDVTLDRVVLTGN